MLNNSIIALSDGTLTLLNGQKNMLEAIKLLAQRDELKSSLSEIKKEKIHPYAMHSVKLMSYVLSYYFFAPQSLCCQINVKRKHINKQKSIINPMLTMLFLFLGST